jgi:alpha-L-fucosidase
VVGLGTSWSTVATTTITVSLNAGSNTIRFHNDSAYAPGLDRISIR